MPYSLCVLKIYELKKISLKYKSLQFSNRVQHNRWQHMYKILNKYVTDIMAGLQKNVLHILENLSGNFSFGNHCISLKWDGTVYLKGNLKLELMPPRLVVTPAAVDTGTSTGIVDDRCIGFPCSIQSEHSLGEQS
jgi:hypothetical protein